LVLDLSLIQTFDYYTGLVFKVVGCSGREQRILGQGGRYDQLLGHYHPRHHSRPGIGFSLNVDDLQQVLLEHHQLPERLPDSHWLVVPKTPAARAIAFRHAQTLRQSEQLKRVELYLEEDLNAAWNYARHQGIGAIAWCFADGQVESERVAPTE
jgi:ATP phosphoribosyltransferase regulatory subunit